MNRITEFKNELLPGLMTPKIQSKLLCFFGPLTPVEEQELTTPTRDGRAALIAKLVNRRLITETSVDVFRDKCIQKNDADLNQIISLCNKFIAQGTNSSSTAKNWREMNVAQFLAGNDDHNFSLSKIAIEKYYTNIEKKRSLLAILVKNKINTVELSVCYADTGKTFLTRFGDISIMDVIGSLQEIDEQEPLTYIKNMTLVYEAREIQEKNVHDDNSDLTVYIATKLGKLGKSNSDVEWIVNILEKEEIKTLTALKDTFEKQDDVTDFIVMTEDVKSLSFQRKKTLKTVLNPEN